VSNALPEDLATELAHLLDPRTRIAGDVRNVDGGYNIRG
jgi:enoyl-[acyl-carrier protein] reductase I